MTQRDVETTLSEMFDHAVASEQPIFALRAVVQRLLSEGQHRDALVGQLEAFRRDLQAAGRDEAEDVVLDVMDFLAGWCSPHMKL